MDAFTQFLGLGSYQEWDEEKRQEWLISELQSRRPIFRSPEDFKDNENVYEVLKTFEVAARLGGDNLGAYVISMAKQPSDILAVELLQKLAGNPVPQRVSPLFETKADLVSFFFLSLFFSSLFSLFSSFLLAWGWGDKIGYLQKGKKR